jgi:type IV pilus assembly protein PilA
MIRQFLFHHALLGRVLRATSAAVVAILVSACFLAASAVAQGVAEGASEEEAGAVGAVRTINTAEVTYASTYNTGYSVSLEVLGETPPGVKESASRANLITHDLAAGKKGGYIFAYRPGKKDKDGRISVYTVTARPIKWQRGRKSIFSDQSGVIRWTGENRAPTAKDPAI